MAYVLEKLTLESLGKIIDDLEGNERLKDAISFTLRDEDYRPENWVIDIERNCYLVELPLYTKYNDGRRFCLFLNGRTHVLRRFTSISHQFCFDKGYSPSKELYKEVEREALGALKIFGKHGTGRISPLGDPLEEFNAIIVNEGEE